MARAPVRTSAASYACARELAGGDQERAAAHRRVEHCEARESAPGVASLRPAVRASGGRGSRRSAAACRTCRWPCARRDPGSRAPRRSAGACRPISTHRRLVVEQRLVDGAELLDAEVAVGDPLAARRDRRAGACRERQQRPSARFVVEIAALGERRARRREETAVERRDAQIAGPAAGVREAADRAQRVPQTRRPIRALGGVAQGPRGCSSRGTPDATAARARALPRTAGKHAVDDRQRLLERAVDRPQSAAARDQRAEHVARRLRGRRRAAIGRPPRRGGRSPTSAWSSGPRDRPAVESASVKDRLEQRGDARPSSSATSRSNCDEAARSTAGWRSTTRTWVPLKSRLQEAVRRVACVTAASRQRRIEAFAPRRDDSGDRRRSELGMRRRQGAFQRLDTDGPDGPQDLERAAWRPASSMRRQARRRPERRTHVRGSARDRCRTARL